MKASAAYLLTALLSAAQVHATCVPGTRENISPDYIVEYKCDWLRTGRICHTRQRRRCHYFNYHPPFKKCVVGRGEDPFKGDKDEEEDPFAMTCDEEKAACLERETSLKAELATSHAELAASKEECGTGKEDSARLKDVLAAACPISDDTYNSIGGVEYRLWCTRHYKITTPREYQVGIKTMDVCVKLCNARPWCNYAQQRLFSNTCYMYDRKVDIRVTPPITKSTWACAVKK
ncbi:hypothetical protein DER46DRAFT_661863 [Fusarium sp. MPI-SDFR-AT-0072]|nr:hypothetical protein DER46DRAFT_661863 [Fusarium sp. MPI-SDFR-AT-0072]